MDFIGSPLYYFLCGAAFASLVISLILLQKKPQQKAPPPPPPPRPQPTKPRYAAGSDMDRINRNARAVNLKEKRPWDPSTLVGFLIGASIFFFLVFVLPELI